MNIWYILVTPEVSQLEMSALKFSKPSKRELMSVMPETHQSAMGPYVTVAAAGLASNASTASRRMALVVKVFWIVQAMSGGLGEGGGGEGDGGGGLGDSDGGEGDGGGGLGEGVGGEGDGDGGLGEGDGGDGGLGEGGGGGGLGEGGGGEGDGGGGDGDGGGGEGDIHPLHWRTSWTCS